MKKKQILAWLLVLVVGYVVLYCYLHPEELVYREEVYSNFDVESEVPYEPLIKQTNPFVYYVLEFQAWLFFLGILYVALDWKGNKRLLLKLKSFKQRVDK